MSRRKIAISQQRGSWVATVTGGRGAWEIVQREDPRIAIVMDDNDHRFDCLLGSYEVAARSQKEGSWWNWSKHSQWRTLLGANRPFVIRKFVPNTRDAGLKVGVYRMIDLTLTSDKFAFSFDPQRLGEVE